MAELLTISLNLYVPESIEGHFPGLILQNTLRSKTIVSVGAEYSHH